MNNKEESKQDLSRHLVTKRGRLKFDKDCKYCREDKEKENEA